MLGSRLRRVLADERGIALIVALGTLTVLSISVTTVMVASSSSSRHTEKSKGDQLAYALAEAGLNNAMAVLAKPENNALNPAVLPAAEPTAPSNYVMTYEGGTAKWWGVLNTSTSVWTIYGLGIVANPGGAGMTAIRKQISATVPITNSLTQPLNATAWNYLYATNTGSACDTTLSNSVVVTSSLFIAGNLCLENTASVRASSSEPTNVTVAGNLRLLSPGNTIGTSGEPINAAHVGGYCQYNGGTAHTPCGTADMVFATTIDTTVQTGTPPVADYDYWYANATPGPFNFCTTSSNFATTAFENQTTGKLRNNSAGTFNLTPGSNYSCEYWREGMKLGELAWNNTTKTLTIRGAFYFDGSMTAANGATNSYNGQGTIYLSGTFLIDGTTQMCGSVVSGNCDFDTWNPNSEMLAIVSAGGTSTTSGVSLLNSSRFQGSIYATNGVSVRNSSKFPGPMIAGFFDFENSTELRAFPTVDTVPIGMPGNPNVYAMPNPPRNFSG